MLFSYNWLQDHIKGKLPKPEKVADLLTMHAFEVEEVTRKGSDWVFDIDVLPDKAHDTLNHAGIARQIMAIQEKKSDSPKSSSLKAEKGSLEPLRVDITAQNLVPRYYALVIEGIAVKESPKWLKERLANVGVNSLNNIVDITNYAMLDTGHPLHAFDYDAIRGHTMTIRKSRAGESINTLDEDNLLLPRGSLLIEDTDGLIDLAGVKGGKNTGITKATKNIILQAATFDAKTIYRTKKALNYTTQAADIYSHGLDPNFSQKTLERALYLVQELSGGKVVQIIDIYPRPTKAKAISLDLSYAERLLGMKVSSQKAKTILQNLGCKVTQKGKGIFQVEPPTQRLDLAIPEDLIEEIGRITGYQNIAPEFPRMSIVPLQVNENVFWQTRIKDSLKEAGLTEIFSYSFVGEKDTETFLYSSFDRAALAELQNPLSEDYKYLRSSLLENLVKVVAQNHRSFDSVRIFEVGNTFSKKGEDIQEAHMVAGMVTGEQAFYEIKGIVDFLLERMGIAGSKYNSFKPTPKRSRSTLWHMRRAAEIKVGNKEIGFMGEISKTITSSLKIKGRVAAFNIDLEKLMRLAIEERGYRPTSRYPASVRDVAILVPLKVRVVSVLNIINRAGGMLVDDVDLFDMYEGDKIEAGMKNLAFHIVYQSQEKTLTSKEVDTLHKNIIEALEKNPGWEVRD